MFRDTAVPQACNPKAEGKVRLRLVQRSAKLYVEVDTKDNRLLRLGAEMALEVLSQKRRWTCVMLAEVGFGWVHDGQVLSFKDDDVESEFQAELTTRDLYGCHALGSLLLPHIGAA